MTDLYDVAITAPCPGTKSGCTWAPSNPDTQSQMAYEYTPVYKYRNVNEHMAAECVRYVLFNGYDVSGRQALVDQVLGEKNLTQREKVSLLVADCLEVYAGLLEKAYRDTQLYGDICRLLRRYSTIVSEHRGAPGKGLARFVERMCEIACNITARAMTPEKRLAYEDSMREASRVIFPRGKHLSFMAGDDLPSDGDAVSGDPA